MNSKYSVVDNNGLSFINLGTMLEYYKVTPVDYLVKGDEGGIFIRYSVKAVRVLHIQTIQRCFWKLF